MEVHEGGVASLTAEDRPRLEGVPISSHSSNFCSAPQNFFTHFEPKARCAISGAMNGPDGAVDLPEDRRGPMARFEEFVVGDVGVRELVQRVAAGEGLRAICRSKGLPHGRVMMWLMEDDERFGMYLKALAASGPFEMEEAKEIADGSDDPRLRVAVRERRAEAHAPGIYGKKVQVGKSVAVGGDAALLGFAGEMLKLVRQSGVGQVPAERVIESSRLADDTDIV